MTKSTAYTTKEETEAICAGCRANIAAEEGATLDWGNLWHHKCYEKERDRLSAEASRV